MKVKLNINKRSEYIINILTLTQKAIVMYLLLILGMYVFNWLNIYTPLLKLAAVFIFIFMLYDECERLILANEKKSIVKTLKLFLPVLVLSSLLISVCNNIVEIKAPAENVASAYSVKDKL